MFDDLISLMDTLLKYGALESTAHGIKEQLKLLKQYLKGDYKVINICYKCKPKDELYFLARAKYFVTN